MATITTDRRRGINSAAAIKVSCVCATTTNITLSGEQTIDGITTSGTRVFVKDQTDTTEIGIYLSSASAWTREPDFDGTYDVTEGTLIPVSRGTANSDTWWRVTNTGTITIGTTALTVSAGLTSVGVSATSAITDESVDTTCFPIFVTDATGNATLHSGTNLTFNSATGELGITILTATGAISGTTVTASGIVSVDDVTQSTSTITGSIHTDGGAGIAKDVFVGGNTNVAGIVNVNGGQVAFPATAVPSANANTLDDYQEGSWTPVLSDGTNNATATSGNVGKFVKIGRMVHITCRVITSSLGSVSGSLRVTGLPFTCVNLSNSIFSLHAGNGSGLAITAGHVVTALVTDGTTYFSPLVWDATTGGTSMQDTEWTADGNVTFSGYYETDE